MWLCGLTPMCLLASTGWMWLLRSQFLVRFYLPLLMFDVFIFLSVFVSAVLDWVITTFKSHSYFLHVFLLNKNIKKNLITVYFA